MTDVVLNNLSLSSGNYKVRRITHDQGTPLELNVLDIARQDGAKLISSEYRPKEITIEGIVKGTTQSDLEANLDSLKRHCSGTNLALDITYRSGIRRYIVSVPNIAITRDQQHITFAPYSLTCQVLDPPFGQDTIATETLSVQNLTNFNETLSAIFTGTARPKPRFEFIFDSAGGIEKVTLKNQITNQQLQAIYTAGLQDSDILVVDTDKLIVQRNAQNIDFLGVFPDFELGENPITLTFETGDLLDQEQASSNNTHTIANTNLYLRQSFQVSVSAYYNRVDILTYWATDNYPPTLPYYYFYLDLYNSAMTLLGTATNRQYKAYGLGGQTYNWPSTTPSWQTFNFTPIFLNSGQTYYMVLRLGSNPPTGNSFCWRTWSSEYIDAYVNGASSYSENAGSTWYNYSWFDDRTFRIYRSLTPIHSVDMKITYTKRWL